MEIRLDGEVAVVTGAASGIGRGVALSFAAAGAAVVALDKAAGGLAAVTAEIESMHGSCSAHEVDVSAPDQVEIGRRSQRAAQRLGEGQGPLGQQTAEDRQGPRGIAHV